MFVEGEVEIKVRDRAAAALDDHEMKLWIQRAFKDSSCYRISGFRRDQPQLVRAVVALNTDILSDGERQRLEKHPEDVGALRVFMERLFEGKGTCRSVGEPQLKPQ